MRFLYTTLSIIGLGVIVFLLPGYINQTYAPETTAGLFHASNMKTERAGITSSTEKTTEITKSATSTIPAVSTSTPKAKTAPRTQSAQSTKPEQAPAVQAEVSQSPEPRQKPVADLEKINQETRPAVVNILCAVKGSALPSITGSGVIVDPRGVILTNAHIGQFLLLRNFREKDSVVCQVRTGSPAYPTYNAELMYISPRWIEENKNLLKGSELKGTGERDFALLHITGKLDGTPLPDSFPYLVPSGRENFESDESVVLVSYPAGFLGNILVVKDLNLSSAVANIQKIYTFGDNTPDVLSIPGSILSQKGASGGAVVDQNKNLVGIITTATDATTTAGRDLHAITIGYISRTIADETSASGLFDFLAPDPARTARTFEVSAGADLSSFLIEHLSEK